MPSYLIKPKPGEKKEAPKEQGLSKMDAARIALATTVRAAGPWAGGLLGALAAQPVAAVTGGAGEVVLPATTLAGRALGGSLSEALAEKYLDPERSNPGHHVNLGRVGVSGAVGAIPGSWLGGGVTAGAAKGAALGYGATAGNKYFGEGKTLPQALATDWKGSDIVMGPVLGAAVGGATNALHGGVAAGDKPGPSGPGGAPPAAPGRGMPGGPAPFLEGEPVPAPHEGSTGGNKAFRVPRGATIKNGKVTFDPNAPEEAPTNGKDATGVDKSKAMDTGEKVGQDVLQKRAVIPAIKKVVRSGAANAVADTRPSGGAAVQIPEEVTVPDHGQAIADQTAGLTGSDLNEPPSETTQAALANPANKRMLNTQVARNKTVASKLANAEAAADLANTKKTEGGANIPDINAAGVAEEAAASKAQGAAQQQAAIDAALAAEGNVTTTGPVRTVTKGESPLGEAQSQVRETGQPAPDEEGGGEEPEDPHGEEFNNPRDAKKAIKEFGGSSRTHNVAMDPKTGKWVVTNRAIGKAEQVFDQQAPAGTQGPAPEAAPAASTPPTEAPFTVNPDKSVNLAIASGGAPATVPAGLEGVVSGGAPPQINATPLGNEAAVPNPSTVPTGLEGVVSTGAPAVAPPPVPAESVPAFVGQPETAGPVPPPEEPPAATPTPVAKPKGPKGPKGGSAKAKTNEADKVIESLKGNTPSPAVSPATVAGTKPATPIGGGTVNPPTGEGLASPASTAANPEIGTPPVLSTPPPAPTAANNAELAVAAPVVDAPGAVSPDVKARQAGEAAAANEGAWQKLMRDGDVSKLSAEQAGNFLQRLRAAPGKYPKLEAALSQRVVSATSEAEAAKPANVQAREDMKAGVANKAQAVRDKIADSVAPEAAPAQKAEPKPAIPAIEKPVDTSGAANTKTVKQRVLDTMEAHLQEAAKASGVEDPGDLKKTEWDRAIATAHNPEAAPQGQVKFSVPGDGSFTVKNNPVAIRVLMGKIARENKDMWQDVVGKGEPGATPNPAVPATEPSFADTHTQNAKTFAQARGQKATPAQVKEIAKTYDPIELQDKLRAMGIKPAGSNIGPTGTPVTPPAPPAPAAPILQSLAEAGERYGAMKEAKAAGDQGVEPARSFAGREANRLAKEAVKAKPTLDEINASSLTEKAKEALRNQRGSINPVLAARLGLGTAGALTGAAVDKDDRLRGALIGGSLGAAVPSIPGVASGLESAANSTTTKDMVERIPNILKFNYLASKNGLAANMVGAPTGLGGTTAIERMLEGMFGGDMDKVRQGGRLLKEMGGIPGDFRSSIREAENSLQTDPMNVGESLPIAQAKTPFDRILAKPASWITAQHMALRNAAMRAGFTEPEATEIALGNEPINGSGNQTLRVFGQKLQKFKSPLKVGDETVPNTIGNTLLPFSRTASNVLAATPTRTPGVGLLAKAMGQDIDWPQLMAQQTTGAGVSTVAYQLGKNMDADQAKLARKWVRNLGGRYGLVAAAAFEAGQAARAGKDQVEALGKGFIQGAPMPTTEVPTDIVSGINDLAHGEAKIPRAAIPIMFQPEDAKNPTQNPLAVPREMLAGKSYLKRQ